MTLFTTTNYPVSALIEDIALGKIGLPELQRPFVWPNVNVRNLFDSLYRGYPAGFLLFWNTGVEAGLRSIGANPSKSVPKLAIVDGQQRLTSLYAVIKGEKVLRSDFSEEHIFIAFNPLSERFDVADAAIRKDKAYISDISELWRPGTKLIAFAKNFISRLSETRELTEAELEKIEDSISRLHNLPQYTFVALEMVASVDAATIADIFVRINGEGKKLNQSDFIMTLMSVFWDEGRAELESFALQATQPSVGQTSPFNHFIEPAPDQMLRVTVGLSLKRARLESVYSVLRGRDAKTGLDIPERREAQFALMRNGQKAALNVANWHHFMSSLTLAGYRGRKMISSETAIIYSYVLYLIGTQDYDIKREEMRQAIAEFYFMAALTGRYTSSPETRFESDLSSLSSLPDGKSFRSKLRQVCATALTSDYWAITLPNQLATSAARSPSLFAYFAALISLDALALYSPVKISSLVDPAINSSKSAFEQHHLYPREFLKKQGITDIKKINQIANFAFIEWPKNIEIGYDSPTAYAPVLDKQFSATQREKVYFWHALPPLWWEMSYEEFLVERRVRMSNVVHAAWKQLTGDAVDLEVSPMSVSELVSGGESDAVEFKSTMRTNLHTGQVDDKIQMGVLKTIAGFLNAKGGTLLIGIKDDGEPNGLSADGFGNEDKMELHLVNLIKERIGDIFLPYTHAHFDDYESERVLAVRCEKGPRAAFVREGSASRFFVRGGNSTAELVGSSLTDYVKQRFK